MAHIAHLMKQAAAGDLSDVTLAVADPQTSTANKVLPLYSVVTDTAPSDYLSFDDLAAMCEQPSVKKKTLAPALTPFYADNKRKTATQEASYHAIVQDHDDDDLIKDEIRVKYNQYRTAFLAFTSASHQQEKGGITANRWKVVIPLSEPVSLERYTALAVGMTLLNGTDASQIRSQQVFFAPNKISHDAPFDYINMLDREPLDGNDDSNPIVKACLEKFDEYQREQSAKAESAKVKPRSVTHIPDGEGIIGKMVSQYNISDELRLNGCRKIGKAYLSPHSSTGTPGIVILERDGKEVCYSHHGATDPLSNLNNDGHSLDVVDVKAAFEFGGDIAACIAHYAPLVDPDGQKKRQQEEMQRREAEQNIKALESALDDSQADDEDNQGNCNVDLLTPPGLAGDICRLIDLEARRPRPELYPLAALHLIAMIGSERESEFTNKLNLITLGIASTAAGKEAAQNVIKALAHEVYASRCIHGNSGSFKDLIYNLIEGDGKSLYVVDEVHSFLGSMKDKNAATYESKMETEILTMNTTELYTFRGMEKRALVRTLKDDEKRLQKALDEASEGDSQKIQKSLDKVQNRIEWLENGMPRPFFSLMGHSVPERLDSFINLDNIDGGFLGRTLIVRCPDVREKLRRKKGDAGDKAFLKMSIAESLKRISKSGNIITPTDEAREYLDRAVDWYDADEQLNHPIVGGIYARAPEQLYRVATILGLSHESITLDDAKYAHALVQQSISDVKHILLKAYAEAGGADEQRIKQHAREVVHRNCQRGGATESVLRQRVEKPKGWQELKRNNPTRDLFAELIEWMLENGELTVEEKGKRRRLFSKAV